MIWIILVIGSILRLINLSQSLWLDEGINIMAAQKFSFWGMMTQYAQADFHPPGYFAIIWIWGRLFGYSEISMRLPSVIFGVITIFLVYLIGKKLISKEIGLASALLLAINPLHIFYSQEARMYSLATFAVIANIFLLVRMVKGEKLNLGILFLSNLLILLSDYIAYFIFPAQLIFLLIIGKKGIIKKWVMALICALIIFVLWLPIFLSQLNIGSIASSQLPTWKFVVGSFDSKNLPLTFVKFIIGRISLADKMIYAAILLPVCSLFIFLLWRSIKQLNDLPRSLLLTWLIFPPLVATAISLVIPVYSYFRVLFTIPSFVILIAIGILSFKSRLRYIFLTSVILIEVYCSLVYLLNSAYQREDWKGLVNFFKNQDSSIILFESSGTLPPFDYYAKNSLNARGALKDFPARDGSSVVDLGTLLNGEKEVYLVDYLVQITDPSRLVAKKLNGLGYKVEETKDFTGVGFVYRYVKNEI